MVMGLFMAISLIGSLWFILGIGHAIFVRDTAIEAADHVAFSAAAVHARGMNFIAALNLVLFALTIIYVALCMAADLLILIGAIGGETKWSATIFGHGLHSKCRPTAVGLAEGVAAPEVVAAVHPWTHQSCDVGHKIAKKAQEYDEKVLQPIFEGVGALEKVIQVGMPIAAEAAAVTIGHNYSPYVGIALTGSLIPKISKGQDPGFGLPVRPQKNDYLCLRTFVEVKKFIDDKLPGFAKPLVHFVMDKVQDKIMGQPPEDKNGSKIGYPHVGGIGCNGGKPWGRSDIRVVSKTDGNGGDDFQVWGMIFNAKDDDAARSEEKVSMSKHKGLIEASQPPRTRIYYSQAEYYFDCRGAWGDDDCYKDSDDAQRLASFSMNWRARLDRVRAPSFGHGFIGLATELTMSGGSLTSFISGKLSEYRVAQKLEGAISKLRNGSEDISFSRTGTGETMDEAINALNGEDKPIH